MQHTYDDLYDKKKLRFDFAVITNDDHVLALVEYNGEQHYRPVNFSGSKSSYRAEKNFFRTRDNDYAKAIYCKKHSIPLLVIKYTQNTEEILRKFILPKVS